MINKRRFQKLAGIIKEGMHVSSNGNMSIDDNIIQKLADEINNNEEFKQYASEFDGFNRLNPEEIEIEGDEIFQSECFTGNFKETDKPNKIEMYLGEEEILNVLAIIDGYEFDLTF